MADAVSHRRAKVLGLMLAGRVEVELGQFVEAQDYLERGLELARTMSAGNFEAQALKILAELNAAQGRMSEARDFAERAIEVVHKVGMTFIGPSVLATKAALTEDQRHTSTISASYARYSQAGYA
jgi:tetratricopeptide (TPR) repeat protein